MWASGEVCIAAAIDQIFDVLDLGLACFVLPVGATAGGNGRQPGRIDVFRGAQFAMQRASVFSIVASATIDGVGERGHFGFAPC